MSAQVAAASQDEVLSDQQIQSLLLEAEARLRSAQGGTAIQAPSDSTRIPVLDSTTAVQPYIREADDVAAVDETRGVTAAEKKLADTLRSVSQPVQFQDKKSKEKPTAGPEWFNLPKTNMTPELKRDLQLLRMRSVLDPHRHYKKESSKAKAPEYSQVGTIIEGPTEFFSSRISKKDRKRTFVEETMASERESGRFQRKYNEIQVAKTSGKKAHYKSVQAKRSGGKKFG
ncbi:hypothetical protein FQN53_000902 [Emmonsiellopsis sp. PD_33]|nr:hypothetical protein FQN53_000902 [Emmonsiellopsis sp. PD_33]